MEAAAVSYPGFAADLAAPDRLAFIRAMVIAIDGPAGAGKSTVARAVAERLGFTYLDTGAMYRCVALAVSEGASDAAAAVARAPTIELGDRVLLDGRDVTDAIRTPAVSAAASQVSADPGVRDGARAQAAASCSPTATGSPRAATSAPSSARTPPVKVFLTASPEVRARRRAERARRATSRRCSPSSASATRATREREHSPLVAAADAVPVDTTELDLDGVVEQIVTLVVEAREVEA